MKLLRIKCLKLKINQNLQSFIKDRNIMFDYLRDITPFDALLMSSVYAITFYIAVSLVFYVIFKEYQKVPWKDTWGQIYQSTYSLLLASPFSAILQYNIYKQKTGYIYYNINDYSLLYFIVSFIACYMITDTLTYWLHRWFHTPFMYNNFHWVHHQYHPISSFSSSSLGVIDLLINGIFPVYLSALIMPIHAGVFLAFSWFTLFWSVYLHTPTAPRIKWLIYDSGDHYCHHQTGRFNYSIYSRFWDWIQNTYKAT